LVHASPELTTGLLTRSPLLDRVVSFSGVDDRNSDRDDTTPNRNSQPMPPDSLSRSTSVRTSAPELATVSEVPTRRRSRPLEAQGAALASRESRGIAGSGTVKHFTRQPSTREPQSRTSGTPQADLLVRAMSGGGTVGRPVGRGGGTHAAGARQSERLAGERLTSGKTSSRTGKEKVQPQRVSTPSVAASGQREPHSAISMLEGIEKHMRGAHPRSESGSRKTGGRGLGTPAVQVRRSGKEIHDGGGADHVRPGQAGLPSRNEGEGRN
jgi:hypothetical protein